MTSFELHYPALKSWMMKLCYAFRVPWIVAYTAMTFTQQTLSASHSPVHDDDMKHIVCASFFLACKLYLTTPITIAMIKTQGKELKISSEDVLAWERNMIHKISEASPDGLAIKTAIHYFHDILESGGIALKGSSTKKLANCLKLYFQTPTTFLSDPSVTAKKMYENSVRS